MKILIMSWRGPQHPRSGGAEIVNHEHAKSWVEAGHEVILFTSYFKGGKQVDNIDGINIIRRGNDLTFSVVWKAFLWYLFENNKKFDLVVDHFHGWPFFTPFYIRSRKVAFIHEVARNVWKFNPYSFPLNKIAEYIGYIFEPSIIFVLYFFTHFITVSESTKKSLMNWGVSRKNISVVQNGVFVPHEKESKEKNKTTTLMYLGALTEDKGIKDALEVFRILSKERFKFNFWIVGKGDKDYIKFLKNSSQDIKGLKFWGFVDQRRKFDLLSKAHVLVNPSKLEGWGLVVIEAAAMGTPTVGYKVPGLIDSVKQNVTGILTEESAQKMAEAVQRLLNDKIRYEYMRKECIAWSKKFKWEKSTKKSLHIIESMLESKKF